MTRALLGLATSLLAGASVAALSLLVLVDREAVSASRVVILGFSTLAAAFVAVRLGIACVPGTSRPKLDGWSRVLGALGVLGALLATSYLVVFAVVVNRDFPVNLPAPPATRPRMPARIAPTPPREPHPMSARERVLEKRFVQRLTPPEREQIDGIAAAVAATLMDQVEKRAHGATIWYEPRACLYVDDFRVARIEPARISLELRYRCDFDDLGHGVPRSLPIGYPLHLVKEGESWVAR